MSKDISEAGRIYSYRGIECRQDYSEIHPDLLKKGIYKIVNVSNNKFYIGSTNSNFIYRFKTHAENLSKGTHANAHLQASFNKYGKDSFIFCIVEVVGERELIKEKEQSLLDQFCKTDTCYNISTSALAPMLGRKHTKEALEKMSRAAKARAKEIGEITRKHRTGTKHPRATIEKMRISARKRDDSVRIAVLKTEEFRKKQSVLHKGKKRSKEFAGRMHLITKSPEYRQKMSEIKKGTKFSEETKTKMAIARGGKKHIFVKNGLEYEVLNVRGFCKENNLSRDTVRRIIKTKSEEEYGGWKLVRTLNSILLAMLLCGACLAETPSDTCLKSFIQHLKATRYRDGWEYYPLTKFPYLTAQHTPWQAPCATNYVLVANKGNIACSLEDGTCYIGTRCLIDSVYLYRAECYKYEHSRWTFIEDYIIVTDMLGEPLGVHKRDTPEGDYQKVILYGQ